MKVKIKTLAWKQLSHSTWLAIMTCYFLVFLFLISAFCLLFGWILFLAKSLSSLWNIFSQYLLLAANPVTVCAFEKAHFRLPKKTNGNLANQRKLNFYKRWPHELRHRGPPAKIALGPLPFNPALLAIHSCSPFTCRGGLRKSRADCSTVVLNCVTRTW